MAFRIPARFCTGPILQRHIPINVLARNTPLTALASTARSGRYNNKSGSSSTSDDGGVSQLVFDWAKKHNVGYPRELDRLHAKAEVSGVLTVKYARRQLFRAHHLHTFFTEPQHPMAEYWLYKYGLDLEAAPLWIQMVAVVTSKPVVRTCARRRLRVALHAALQEAGWSPEGWPWEEEQEGGPPWGSRPALRGTIVINVTDPVRANKLTRDQCLDFARKVVKEVVAKQGEEPPKKTKKNASQGTKKPPFKDFKRNRK